eukprot:17197-Heterococcus_DN1.PRE.1
MLFTLLALLGASFWIKRHRLRSDSAGTNQQRQIQHTRAPARHHRVAKCNRNAPTVKWTRKIAETLVCPGTVVRDDCFDQQQHC